MRIYRRYKNVIFVFLLSVLIAGCSTIDHEIPNEEASSKNLVLQEVEADVVKMESEPSFSIIKKEANFVDENKIEAKAHVSLIMKKMTLSEAKERYPEVSFFSNSKLSADSDFWLACSPVKGIYRDNLTPDRDPLVKVGDEVSNGQTLCYIEVMLIYAHIDMIGKATIKGKCKRDGESVDVNDLLFVLVQDYEI